MRRSLSTAYFFVVPILAFFFLVFISRFGIGITPDSMIYISAAQLFVDTGEFKSILDGIPLQYMTHYPPGMSIGLTVFNAFTNDFYNSFRLLNALSLYGFLLAVALVFRSYISTLSIITLQLLILVNLSFFDIYEMAWTEPLYILLSFLALYTLNLFVNKLSIKWLIISSILISFSILIRYIGISLIITAVVYIWITLSKERVFTRIKYIIILGLLSSTSFVYWSIRNILLVNSSTGRDVSFHPMPLQYYQEWLTTTSKFTTSLSVNDLGLIASYIIGALIIILSLIYSAKVLIKVNKSFDYLLILYPITYFIFLFTSNTFYDHTPLYYRIISPVYILFAISLYISFVKNENIKNKTKVITISILIVLHIAKFGMHLIKTDDSKEYNSKEYVIEDTVEKLKHIDKSILTYVNDPDRYYLLTDGAVADWLKNIEGVKVKDFYVVSFYNGRKQNTDKLNKELYKITTIYNTKDVLVQRWTLL